MNATSNQARMQDALKQLASAAHHLTLAMQRIEDVCGTRSARLTPLNIARAAINAEIDDIKKTWQIASCQD